MHYKLNNVINVTAYMCVWLGANTESFENEIMLLERASETIFK